MTKPTIAGLAERERERFARALDADVYGSDGDEAYKDWLPAVDRLMARGFGDVSAERERAEQAEVDAQRAEDQANTLASEVAEYESLASEQTKLSERHMRLRDENKALRARIEAALGHAFEYQDSNGGWPHVVALMHAALAGDQPEGVQP